MHLQYLSALLLNEKLHADLLVVVRQHTFLLNKELGFQKDEVIMVPIRGTNVKTNFESFKTELTKDARIVSASAISDIIGSDVPNRPFRLEGKEKAMSLPGFFVDHEFLKTFDIELLEGRDFNRQGRDDSLSLIVNRAALELIDSLTWLDQRIMWGVPRNIIGVVENFHYANLKLEMRPLMIIISPSWYAYVGIRIKPGEVQETISYIESVWKEFEGDRPFVPFFLDSRLESIYKNEQQMGQLVGYFSGLAIFIAILGLFGLSTYATQQRVKEIGIRKVLGASLKSIIKLLSWNFAVLVLIANLIAWPIAWYVMNGWLQGFTFSTTLSIWIFIMAGVLTLAITIFIVGGQSFKTAVSNPVDSLRDE